MTELTAAVSNSEYDANITLIFGKEAEYAFIRSTEVFIVLKHVEKLSIVCLTLATIWLLTL